MYKRIIITFIFVLSLTMAGCFELKETKEIYGEIENAKFYDEIGEDCLQITLEDGTTINCKKWDNIAKSFVLDEENWNRPISLTFENKITLQIVNERENLLRAELR